MRNKSCSDGYSFFKKGSIEVQFGGRKASYDTNYKVSCEISKNSFLPVSVLLDFNIKFPGQLLIFFYEVILPENVM